jgi:hypothetical protein
MGLKHRKYIYVKRSDGFYVKVRVLNLRFGEKMEQVNLTDPSRFIITGYKTVNPPPTAVVVDEEVLPEDTRRSLYLV